MEIFEHFGETAKVDDLICLADDPNDLQATQVDFSFPKCPATLKYPKAMMYKFLNLERNAKTSGKFTAMEVSLRFVQ